MAMAENGLFDHMVAYDPSPGSIDLARSQAHDRGLDHLVEFRQADVNSIELPEAAFDVVHINMALHHVAELEHVLYQINRALRPGGLFLANEYVGPSQFQFDAQRMDIVNGFLQELPERLRWNPIANETKTSHPRFPRQYWDEVDPTEAVRSDEIPDLLAVNFPNRRRIDYGGNLLNLALENIGQNFDPESPDDASYIDRLFQREDEVLQQETSDFAYFVCPRGPEEALTAGRLLARSADTRHRARPVDGADVEALRSLAQIRLESGTGSSRPLVGPLVVRAKHLARRALRFQLSPVAEQQSAFNAAAVDLIARWGTDLTARLDHVEQENRDLRSRLLRRPPDPKDGATGP
jgi:SAM-dependent methyltransferase